MRDFQDLFSEMFFGGGGPFGLFRTASGGVAGLQFAFSGGGGGMGMGGFGRQSSFSQFDDYYEVCSVCCTVAVVIDML
jgi:hypothetical protein